MIDGKIEDKTRPEYSYGCVIDRSGQPSDTCEFVVDDSQTSAQASIMYKQELTSVSSGLLSQSQPAIASCRSNIVGGCDDATAIN